MGDREARARMFGALHVIYDGRLYRSIGGQPAGDGDELELEGHLTLLAAATPPSTRTSLSRRHCRREATCGGMAERRTDGQGWLAELPQDLQFGAHRQRLARPRGRGRRRLIVFCPGWAEHEFGPGGLVG
jgi:hypothetical protein